MRKRIIHPGTQGASADDYQGWLDVEHLVQVELTSEDAEHPIESALIMNAGSGWRAIWAKKRWREESAIKR